MLRSRARNALLSGASVVALSSGSFWPIAAVAQSLPTNGSVVSGAVGIAQSGSKLTVTQSTATGIVNWSTFSIAQGNQVAFENGAGATLNRVTGNVPSSLNGLLTATGSVYLINPAGIAVGPTGVIQAGGSFVGSTLDIADDKFHAGGSLTFSGNSTASVVNLGKIGSSRGDVVLIAQQVENAGSIRARNGTVGLVSGTEVTVRDQEMADGKIAVSLPAVNGSVRNSGTIRGANAELRANGGNVYALGLNTNSVIKATGVASRGGRVFLTATGGNVYVSQRISAQRKQTASRNAPKDGGQIVVTGDNVTVAAGAKLDASGETGGTILIGGDRAGGSNASQNFASFQIANAQNTTVEAGATINADGSNGNGGNIVVWSDQLTSYAGAISARGGVTAGDGGFAEVSGHLLLDYTGTADLRAPFGRTGTLLLDPFDVTISSGSTSNGSLSSGTFTPSGNSSVINATTLVNALGTANVNVTTGSSGSQNGDITVSSALTWASGNTLTLNANRNIAINADITATNGGLYLFAGSFLGNFDNVTNNPIGSPGTITATGAINVGTFTLGEGNWTQNTSTLPAFAARNFSTDVNIWFSGISGSFVRVKGGDGSAGSPYQIADVYGLMAIGFSPVTTALNYKLANNIDAGGLADFTSIGNDTTPDNFTGVLDGQNFTISNLTSTGAANGMAGLFGWNFAGTVKDLTLANVTIGGPNATEAGALAAQVGVQGTGTVTNVSVVGGTVTSPNSEAGGLVGVVAAGSTISNSSAIGVTVTATGRTNNVSSAAGGLVGQNQGTITQSYATGAVNGTREAGGLVGLNSGTISQSYATGAVTLAPASGSTGTGSLGAGGLVGVNVAFGGTATITQSYATGSVTLNNANAANVPIGSFVGANSGTINEAYGTGYVTIASGTGTIGGFSGANTAVNRINQTGNGTLTNTYYDMGTTGQSAQTGGLTTAQLQGTLPSGFNTVSAGVWATGAGRYPYFAWRFASAPDVVSGTAYTDQPSAGGAALAGAGLNLLVNGVSVADASSGANGYYYFFTDAGSVSGSSGVLATLTGTTKGNTFTDTAISGTMSGLDVYGGYLRVASATASYSSIVSNLVTALGSNTGSNYLFTAGAGPTIALKTDTNLEIDSSASSLNINQAITAGGTGTVTVVADDMALSNAITTAGTTVKLTTATAGRGITLGGSAAGTLSLSAAELSQITAGTLQIGNDGNTSGAIMVTGAIAPSTVTNLKLLSGSTVSQTASSTITAANLAATATGDITLAESNSVSKVALSSTAGAISFRASGALTVGSVAGLGGVTAAGTATVRADGNLILDATAGTVSASGSGTALQLVTGGTFTNNKGSGALSVTGGGRWLVWSANPTNDTRGGLSYAFKQYSAIFGTTTVAQSTGNGFLYSVAPSLTVALSGTVSKVYDRTTSAAGLSATNFNVSGALDGDTVNVSNSGGSFSQADVGTGLSVSATGLSVTSATNGAATVYGYSVSGSASGNIGEITAKPLTISGAKTYDQSAAFTSSQLSLSGIISGDAATLTGGSASVSSANAGGYSSFSTNTLTVSNSNYTATGGGITVTATINKAPLTITGTKTYDASAAFTTGQLALSGFLVGDSGTITGGSASVSSPNATTYSSFASNTLTVSNSNYTASGAGTTVSATIGKAPLTITAATNSKTYDGTISASGTPTVGGLRGSDTVTALAETYDNKNVGNGKALSVSGYTLNDGNNGNNYTVSTVSNTTGGIIAKAVTAAADAVTKTQGATDPAFTYQLTSGALAAGDAFSGALTRAAGENPGTYAITRGTLVLSANYVLTFVDGQLTISQSAPTGIFGTFSDTFNNGQGTQFTSTFVAAAPGNQPVNDTSIKGDQPFFCSGGDQCASTPFPSNLQFGQWITYQPGP